MKKRSCHIVLTSPSNLKRQRGGWPAEVRWLYLGKDSVQRREAEMRLGRACRWELGDALHQVSDRLRRPFVEFVGEVGAQQRDAVAWWSSRFSWKMWTASDFFLLICYLAVAQEVIHEAKALRIPLLIVVEDPWLLRQLQENTASEPSVLATQTSLLGVQLRLMGLGLLKRAWWLGKTAWGYWRQRRVWPTRAPFVPSQPTAAIFSPPQASSFQDDGGWIDPYLPQLDQHLQALGYEVIRFCAPEATGWERPLATRAAYVQPLMLWATPRGVWRALRAFWWPRWPASLAIEGINVARLAEREWWQDLGHSSWCVFQMFYECLARMLRQGAWRVIAHCYENQPWEKMIALCAQTRGIRAVGVQTSVFSRYYLPFFSGKDEAARMPLPDIVCTSGPYAQRLLTEGGPLPYQLRCCGAIRYPHVANSATSNGHGGTVPEACSDILIALPVDRAMAEHLLAAVRGAFPDGGASEGLRFRVKPHPISSISQDAIGFPAQVMPSSFSDTAQALSGCGLVLFAGSTIGFEAMAMGKVVVRYRSPWLLDVDEVYGASTPVCSDETLRDVILAYTRAGSLQTRADHRAILSDCFVPLDLEALREVFAMEGSTW